MRIYVVYVFVNTKLSVINLFFFLLNFALATDFNGNGTTTQFV